MENTLREFKKGEIIFKEGDFEMCMYDLLRGKVGIYTDYGTENEKLLTELDGKDCPVFGEMGLVEEMPRSATAVALEDVKAQMITKETFGDYFKDNTDAVIQIMQHMSRRLRIMTGNYLDACRAVKEAVDNEEPGKKRSSWFKNNLKKFLEAQQDSRLIAYAALERQGFDTFID